MKVEINPIVSTSENGYQSANFIQTYEIRDN